MYAYSQVKPRQQKTACCESLLRPKISKLLVRYPTLRVITGPNEEIFPHLGNEPDRCGRISVEAQVEARNWARVVQTLKSSRGPVCNCIPFVHPIVVLFSTHKPLADMSALGLSAPGTVSSVQWPDTAQGIVICCRRCLDDKCENVPPGPLPLHLQRKRGLVDRCWEESAVVETTSTGSVCTHASPV